MELTQGLLRSSRLSRAPPGRPSSSVRRLADPRLLANGLAVLVPLAVTVTIIVLTPNARAVSLLWPLVALTIIALTAAVLGSLALGQPQQRSIVHLRRLARRALMGDIVGSVLPSTTRDLKPIAQDLVELAHEIERTRASLDRVTRDLRLTHDGNESLVSTLAIANTRLRAEASLVHDFVETANRPLDR